VFGVSPGELIVLGLVALLVVGPDKLPSMLRSLGAGLNKLRRVTADMRNQSGIDEVLRAEGLRGGLDELRGLVRGQSSGLARVARNLADAATQPRPAVERAPTVPLDDRSREYPPEGADAAGALPEDLLADAQPIAGAAGPTSADEHPVAPNASVDATSPDGTETQAP
jgi:sec-independent protein translocase protein TatB